MTKQLGLSLDFVDVDSISRILLISEISQNNHYDKKVIIYLSSKIYNRKWLKTNQLKFFTINNNIYIRENPHTIRMSEIVEI